MLSPTHVHAKQPLFLKVLCVFSIVFCLTSSGTVFAFPGNADPDFGQDGSGFVNLAPNGYDCTVCGLGLTLGDKIIVGGSGGGGFIAQRLLPDGSIDETFGNDGLAILANEYEQYYCTDFIVLPAGDMLMVGQTLDCSRAALGYLDSHGQKDGTFGAPDGVITLDVFGSVHVRPTGLSILGSDIYISGYGDKDENAFMVTRLDGQGNLQQSFGNNGVASATFGNDRRAMCLDVAPKLNGDIIAVGQVRGHDEVWGMGIACFDRSGNLNPSFGLGGVLDLAGDLGEGCFYSVRILPDGSILAAGTLGEDLAVVKFTPEGFPDSNFGWEGVARANLNGGVTTAAATDLVVQASGKIVVVGKHVRDGNDQDSFLVARFTPDGTLDRLFADHGYYMHNFSLDARARATRVVLQTDGKILVAGTSDAWRTTDDDIVVERVEGDDYALGSGGCTSTPVTGMGLILLPLLSLFRR